MTKKDLYQGKPQFKAVNAFIFAGSFSVGTIRAGFDLQKVLEIADDQLQNNAFYFKKNVTDVPVVLPSEWENDEYLAKLKTENIDLMCCNCPCSSLSQINRNAKVDGKNNVHFYRLFNVFKKVQPKAFIIENAPTLLSLGLPILKDMVNELKDDYRFTIVRDYAGNHGVAMLRQRTLVIGWNRNHFKTIPIINQDKQPKTTVKDTIGDLYSDTTNDHKSVTVDEVSDLYSIINNGYSFMTDLAMKYNKHDAISQQIEKRLDGTSYLREVKRIADRLNQKRNFWDKSPYRVKDDGLFPSITSVTEYIHPHQHRTLSLRELARVMNYPDGYDFTDPNKECKIPVTQAIAQGVPANFGQYIATQVRLALEGKHHMIEDQNVDIVFQQHIQHKYDMYKASEFVNVEKIELSKNALKLKD